MADKLISDLDEGIPSGSDYGLYDPSGSGYYKKYQMGNAPGGGGGGGGDTTPPTVVSATVENANPDRIVFVFSESMGSVTTAGHSFKKNGSAWAVSSVSGSGTTWTFVMASAAANGDTLLRSYNSGTGATTDVAGNELASYTDQSVTNNVLGSGDLPHSSPFTAANGTLLTAYTPASGNGFSNVWGSMDIQGNRASVLTVGAGGTVAVSEMGTANVTITLIGARIASTSRKIYIIWRYEDDQNFMFLQLYDNTVDLYKIVANSATLISSYTPSPSVSDTNDHTLVLTTGATNCALTIDGNSVFSGVANDPALTGTKAGFGATGVGLAAGDVTFDSFNVV